MAEESNSENTFQPVVQLVDMSKVQEGPSAQEGKKLRVMMNDSEMYAYCLIGG